MPDDDVTTESALVLDYCQVRSADGHRQDATKIVARWPFTAQLLHELAASYDSEARREDEQADWSDHF